METFGEAARLTLVPASDIDDTAAVLLADVLQVPAGDEHREEVSEEKRTYDAALEHPCRKVVKKENAWFCYEFRLLMYSLRCFGLSVIDFTF